MPKIMLLDANALVHRSFHALPPLTSPKGEQVNAVYGFASALLKALKDEEPDYVVACFDAGKETFRNQIYKEYKAHRKETDQALAMQFPRVQDIVHSLNIPLFALPGFEADDLIGSLSRIAGKEGLQVVIVTGDNDALQLVNDQVSVYSLRRGVTDTLSYNRHAVKERLGVFPEQVVDYKALAGDSSDNIPGAPGIGPKTASELLDKYQTLDNIYQHLNELSERQRNILKDNKKQVMMSRQLGQIKTDLKIELDLKKAATVNFDFTKVVTLFHELGFKSLLSRLPTAPVPTQGSLFGSRQSPPTDKIAAKLPYRAITNLEDWQELHKRLIKEPYLVVDTETVDLEGELIGVAFAWSADEAAYLPVSPAYPEGLALETIRTQLAEILSGQSRKIGHNFKFDLWSLGKAGFDVTNVWFDTMIASQLINSQLFSHGLDEVAFSELGFRKIPTSQLLGNKKDGQMSTVALDELAAYACEDVLVTWRLFERFRPDLEEQSLKRVFYEIEMPLLPVLYQMERAGIKIDGQYLRQLGKELTNRLASLQEEIWKSAGEQFNVNSPNQLKVVLFDHLNLPATGLKKVKSGYSTDAETLGKLIDKHPIIRMLLEYRELSKLLNTYINALPQLADKNGRIHTSFQQLGAATGRLASNNPNLQNIPIRTELGNQVRRAFVAETGHLLLAADYSQAELRVLAHLSQDKGLINAFEQGDDFHSAVAKELGVDRRSAKAINFGIIYGLGANALANDLGISPLEARKFIDRYFATFPDVLSYIEGMKRQARETGYVSTVFGRRRYLPDIYSPNMGQRSAAERMAVNMPTQGTVADLMKMAMVAISNQLPPSARMLLQIHDELLFEVENDSVDKLCALVRETMSGVAQLKVPMVTDVKIGENWADMKKSS